MEIPKRYTPETEEKKWEEHWEKEKLYRFDPESEAEVFSVDTPPPTVSGKMHLGHAFSFSQQDFVVRFQRMRGKNVFCPFGTDDNGLPTKMLVEREKGVKAADMERKEFVDLCLKTLERIRPEYVADWKRIGMSCDFDLFYSTINDHSRKISQESFIDLYRQGREYRAEEPAMWCPECGTAISQVELEDKDVASFFNDIIFKVDGEDLEIATTRPELLPACVAVFYHPDDKRFKHLEGKRAKVPLFDFEVPIMEDERADPEKGTGIVMCCTFGDATDAEWQRAHDLPIKEAITRDGKMTALAGKYEGMSVDTARKMIIEDLKDARLLISQTPITHAVNVHERCGTPIEFIHSKQWFVKYLDIKDDMLAWGKELNWFPEHMRHRYDNWVKGLQWDWCISRQLPFGIPFPVWYCKACDEVIVADTKDLPVDPISDDPPVKECPKCKSTEFEPETDIINTWATSSLTPQIAAKLVPERYDDIYPMTMRPQAHDIISFWLFNTVVKSRLHNEVNPWRDCMISGWALDPKGKKMSKSKGNVIAPQEMIEKYSADALRFWAATSKLGEDVPFQEKEFVTAQKLITKLWNAARFSAMHLADFEGTRPEKLWPADEWILAELNEVVRLATEDFENYEFYRVRASAEQFFWHKLADNYLEIIKDRLYNPDVWGEDARKAAQYTLHTVFLDCIKILAPVMPFITESLYQNFFKAVDGNTSIHITEWPKPEHVTDADALAHGRLMVDIVAAVRRYKAASQQSLGAPLTELVITCEDDERSILEPFVDDLRGVTRADSVTFGPGGEEEARDGTTVKGVFKAKDSTQK